MTGHISEELPRLLTGEAPRETVLEAAAHLRDCADCQQELVSAVVAHAALTSARRFAPEIVAAVRDVPAPPPPAAPLPDLSPMFAQVREEAAATSRHRSRRRAALAVAAVAVGAAVGVGGTLAGQSLTSPPAAAQTVALAAYDRGTVPATADIASNGRMVVHAGRLPDPGPSRRYEVWLTNRARTAMQPVGWIGSGGTATLTVPSALMGRFQAIEVSVQDLNSSKYVYSGTSVLRGSYR
jgi:hypothetical protein